MAEIRPVQQELEVSQNDAQVIVKSGTFTYIYSKKSGMFESLTYAGQEYLERPMELNIWRAPTDNDMHLKLEWKRHIMTEPVSELTVQISASQKTG